MYRQVELSKGEGEDSEKCLITKALGGTTEMTQLKMRIWNPTEFHLGESSDKALSSKHAYQAEQKRDPEGLSAPLSGSGREPKRANGVRKSRRNLQKILVPHEHTYKQEK